MSFFLDTDICIAILRGKEPGLERKLQTFPIQDIGIPSVVVAELWVGVEKSENSQRAEKKLRTFLEDLPTISFESIAAKKYGEIRARLEKKGNIIGANDLLIAATCLVHEAALVTRNHREYRRISELKLEVW